MDYAIQEEFADLVRSPISLAPPGHICRLGTGTIGTDDVSLGRREKICNQEVSISMRYIREFGILSNTVTTKVTLDLELIFLIM